MITTNNVEHEVGQEFGINTTTVDLESEVFELKDSVRKLKKANLISTIAIAIIIIFLILFGMQLDNKVNKIIPIRDIDTYNLCMEFHAKG